MESLSAICLLWIKVEVLCGELTFRRGVQGERVFGVSKELAEEEKSMGQLGSNIWALAPSCLEELLAEGGGGGEFGFDDIFVFSP